MLVDEPLVPALNSVGGLDFAAIDVETANSRRGSICARDDVRTGQRVRPRLVMAGEADTALGGDPR